MRIEVKGLAEVTRALRKGGVDVRRDMRQLNKSAAELVADEARRRVPVRTGRLQGTIRATAGVRSGSVRAGNARVPYARVIEFGWSRRNIPAQSYLYAARDAIRDRVIENYERGLNELLSGLGD